MLEKNAKATDCVEFVQYMHTLSFPRKDVKALAQAYPLPENVLKCMGNKRVVLFHIGEFDLRDIQVDFSDYVRLRLDYLRESLAGQRDYFLWWYDDGVLSGLIRDLQMFDKTEEAQALEKEYQQEKQAFIEGKASFYDASMEEERALAWADIYFGDESPLKELFAFQGKPAVLWDFDSLHDGAGKITLDEWLDREVTSSSTGAREGWQEKLRGKRILLYYLSAATLLHRGMGAVERIFSLTECIQDGLVVWWFYDERIDGLLPCLSVEIRKKYQAACEFFVQRGGLLDEGGCSTRAAELANACYMDTDDSAKKLNCLGKPLMVPAEDKLPNFIYIRLRFMAVHMDEEYIYFVPNEDIGTFWGRMRMADGSVDIRLLEEDSGHGLMTKIIGCVPAQDNKLLIYPWYGKKNDELILYDAQDETFEVIKTAGVLGSRYRFPKFSFRSACKYRNKMFAGTGNLPGAVCVDLKSKAVKFIEGMQEAAREANIPFEGRGLHLSCLLGGHFYILYYNNNIIFDVDAEQEKFASIIRLKENMQIRLLETDGEYLWLGTASGEIVRYDVRTGDYSVYEQRMPLYRNEQFFCNGWMIYYEGTLRFFCTYTSPEPEVLYTCFDMKEGEFSGIQFIDQAGWLNNIVWADGGRLLISSKYKDQDKVFLLDLSDMSIREWEFKLSTAQSSALKQQILRDYQDLNVDVIHEEVADVTINDFAEFCLTSGFVLDQKIAGKAIYDFMKGQI